jgi:hypothetical protein
MKKTILFAVLGCMIAGSTMTGCKKGEGDGFLSLSSRKARLAGDWKLESGTQTDVNGSNTTTYTYTATTVSDGTTTDNHTLDFKIAKDGTFESTEVTSNTGYSVTNTMKGRWNFAGKIGDFKNKDHAIFYVDSEVTTTVFGSNTTTSTDTYTGDQVSFIVELHTLKKKELVTKTTYTYTNGTTTSSSKAEMHFNQ